MIREQEKFIERLFRECRQLIKNKILFDEKKNKISGFNSERRKLTFENTGTTVFIFLQAVRPMATRFAIVNKSVATAFVEFYRNFQTLF